jgi:hypothetical protein
VFAPVAQRAGGGAHEVGGPGAEVPGGGGHGAHAGHGPDARPDQRGPALGEPLDEGARAHGGGGGEGGVDVGHDGVGAAGHGGAGVEAVAAEPQQRRPQRHEGPVVRHLGGRKCVCMRER